jgi:hypothetical protein
MKENDMDKPETIESLTARLRGHESAAIEFGTHYRKVLRDREALLAVSERLVESLKRIGFGTDDPIPGSDAVEAVGAVFQVLEGAVKAARMIS